MPSVDVGFDPHMTEADAPLFETDPVLGDYVAHFPSNRLRLLFIGGSILTIIWFIVTVSLWEVEDNLAFTITVTILAIASLVVGWYMSHYWNREVVLYLHGFTFREGSNTASFPYADIATIRQTGKRYAYFGGIIQRDTFKLHLITKEDELIVLSHLYVRLADLTDKLEYAITQIKLAAIPQRLEDNEQISFGDQLWISQEGLHAKGKVLSWDEIGEVATSNGQLILQTASGENVFRLPLEQIDNLRLFVLLLRQRHFREKTT